MPGFSQSLSNEERWDLINYLRALASGERSDIGSDNRRPTMAGRTRLQLRHIHGGESRTLKYHRGDKIVLLVLLNLAATEKRLQQLAIGLPELKSAGVEVIVVPNLIDYLYVANNTPRPYCQRRDQRNHRNL